jgi:hypothetical protein
MFVFNCSGNNNISESFTLSLQFNANSDPVSRRMSHWQYFGQSVSNFKMK